MYYGNSSNGRSYSPSPWDQEVDRFNPSTKSNYNYFDPCKSNNQTYYSNNGQYSNHYNYYNK